MLQLLTILNQAPLDDSSWNFNLGIHLVSIPATVAIGVLIGWMLRDRKAANDEAQREIDAEQK